MATIKRRWRDLAALASLVALSLAFFYRIALTNLILTSQDVFAYFYPYRDFASASLRSGKLPLWNPYLFMGAPLLANSQVAVLYPLHWPLLWLSTPKQLAWSMVLHICLAAIGAYVFSRRAAGLRPLASFLAATIFGLGGFLGAQVEHVNQLNISAWLPWLLLCIHLAAEDGALKKQRRLGLVAGMGIVGLILLAGHTQAAYIVLFAAAVYAAWLALMGILRRRSVGLPAQGNTLANLAGLGALALMVLAGLILAAGQLLPTLELSQLSVRSGGLAYNLASSFSLKPTLIFKALLPPLLWEPPFTEYVAYVGLIGLILALFGAWRVLRPKSPAGAETMNAGGPELQDPRALARSAALVLALLGLFLAFGRYNPVYYLLYKLVPGFALFRVPARWLLLYSFGAALLAGVGFENLPERQAWARPARWGLVLLLLLELFLASRRLPYNNPTAPAAFDSLRSAPAHLLADDDPTPFRFLSMSDIRYDPGDMEDLQTMYSDSLSEQARYDLIVTTKVKEVLAFNLPLRYRLYSVDGYDGGLLPISPYVTLQQLFLPEDQVSLDGRLREELRRVPAARLLSLFNVKYIITDKTQDVWIDDVFYDLEHTVPLGEITLDDLGGLETSQLGIVSYLTGTTNLPDGAPVAEITIVGAGGAQTTVSLLAGEHTAEGLYGARPVAHSQPRVGHRWRDDEQGSDYVAILDLDEPLRPVSITVRSLLPDAQFNLRGLTLIDAQGSTHTLSVEPAYRLVHSGDVKIYENLAVLPRAFVVHSAQVASDDDEALALLRDPAFDPGQAVVLDAGQAVVLDTGPGLESEWAEVLSYEPELVQVRARLDAPGYLVLTDTYYPGWTAEVDGQPVPIQRANLYFRALPLEPGEHTITFHYRPPAVQAALIVSLAAWLLWALALVLAAASTAWARGRQ